MAGYNEKDTFHGRNLNIGDTSASFELGIVKAVNPKSVTADVYFPSRSNTLRNLPISFNFMSFDSGNIAFPEINSPVIVAKSSSIPPFILCSAGKLTNFGVNSDLLQGEQLLSNNSRSMFKQGVNGQQVLTSGNGGIIFQDGDRSTTISDQNLVIRTSTDDEIRTDIGGYALTYRIFQKKRYMQKKYTKEDLMDGDQISLSESRKILNYTSYEITALENIIRMIVEISDIACNQDLSNSDTLSSLYKKLNACFGFFEISSEPEQIVIQQGCAVNEELHSVADLDEKELSVENKWKNEGDDNQTLFSIGTIKDGVFHEDFAVTKNGPRAYEGDIADYFK